MEAASETAAANAASATVLAEQIREMESSVETLKKLDEQEGRLLCAADGYRGISAAYAGADQRPGGREHFRPRKRVSDPICAGGRGRGAGYRRRYGDGHAGSKVRKRENQFVRFSAGWRRGASAALTGSDWQVGKAELTIRLSETEYDCCLPVSALHSDNGGDFVYSVEERNTILGLQNIVRKVYVEVVERNNELAALRNYTTGAPVVAATTKSLQEGARVRTAG